MKIKYNKKKFPKKSQPKAEIFQFSLKYHLYINKVLNDHLTMKKIDCLTTQSILILF